MPALPSVPGVLKVQLNLNVVGDTNALCRFFVHYSGTAPTAAEVSTFCAAVGTSWGSHIKSLCVVDKILDSVQAEDLTSATGAVGAANAGIAGTLAHRTMPASTCFTLGFIIARRYRGGKPKIFLPLLGAEDLDVGNVWLSASLNAGFTAWTAFMVDVLAAGWSGAGTLTHVNVSYYQGFTVVTNPITHRARNVPTLRGVPVVDNVIGYTTENQPATQRRRNQ